MRVALVFSVSLQAATLVAAQLPAAGVAPVSISVRAPMEAQPNPHVALGVHFNAWIVAPATVMIDPDGTVSDVMLRPISVAGLGKTGAFSPGGPALVSDDARLFEEAALAALQGARFERGGGGPRRSFVNIAWKAYGGSMDVAAAESGGVVHHAPGVLARTFAQGTTFYLWSGVDRAVEAKRLKAVDDDSRRLALGLPSESLGEELAPGCRMLDRAPSGRFGANLDEGLQPVEPLELDYPESERRDRVRGIVMLLACVAPDGSVSGIYPARTTPGRPAFAESAIRATCRLRFNEPRFDGQPVRGLHWQHAEFSISAGRAQP